MLSGAARPKSVYVVPLAAHFDGKLYRLDRALLAERLGQFLEFADPVERQPHRITTPVKQGRGERTPNLEVGATRGETAIAG
jgi:hypothetical protein